MAKRIKLDKVGGQSWYSPAVERQFADLLERIDAILALAKQEVQASIDTGMPMPEIKRVEHV